MKFSASQSSLLSAFQLLAAIVPTKSPMPVLMHFLVELSGKWLKITATDLEISMETKVEVNGEKDGRALLPARKFLELLRDFPDVSIHVEAGDSGRIKLKADDKKYNLAGENVQNYPKVPSLEKVEALKISQTQLRRMIAKCGFAVSRDELRPQLTGVYAKVTTEELRFVTTDGHRLVKINYHHNGFSGAAAECIAPAKAMQSAARLCEREGDIEIFFAEKQIAFRVGPTTMIAKLIEGRYPNYEAVIPSENKNKLTMDLDQFQASVRRAAIVSNEISRQIRLKIQKEMLEILVEDIEQGNEGRETVPCSYDGEPMDIGYNAGYVLDVLKQVDTAEVVFDLGTSTSAGIVRPTEQEEKEDLLMLIMPVRLN
ncbi:DNA polymerase III subunit beta [bacterium]|nr:DNA polymerase III subunit beta [bacterium]MBU1983453.1 DNA polymerase III subunit beta [bacterium]